MVYITKKIVAMYSGGSKNTGITRSQYDYPVINRDFG